MEFEIYFIVLFGFIITASLIAVETKNLLSSIISLGAVGFGLSIAFLFLYAPDIAIVQIAVEVILLIFLIRATIKRDIIPVTGHVNWAGLVVSIILGFGLLGFGFWAFRFFKPFGTPVMSIITDSPSAYYLEKGLSETGSGNIVTSVLLDYRAYDTLGEATVLFASIVGALTILRGRARSKRSKKNGRDDGNS